MENYLNTTLRNVAWFRQAHEQKTLEMKPPFQRNPVWVTRQKSYLMDTILNKYPIPEIYMQETADEDGNSKYIIIDGQQRIRSVLEFIAGQFSIDEKESPEFHGTDFEHLSPEQKRAFFQYNFVVRILPDIPDVELRAIFQRLNKNVVALNKQELRQATYSGAFIKLMNAVSDKEMFSKICLFTANDVRRMLDVEFISELAIAMLNGYQNKKDKLDLYYQLYEEDFQEEEIVKESFDVVLGELIKIFPDMAQTRWRKKSDFYTIFLVFANHKECLPLSKDSRNAVRETLLDFADKIGKIQGLNADEMLEYKEDPALEYVRGLRATTDMSSRKYRQNAIEKLLRDFWI